MTPPIDDSTENTGFNGLTVAAFESRMAKEMEDLIVRYGGVPRVAPSLREVPLSENKEAFAFFEALQAGGFDMLILMTGVGAKTLFSVLESRYPKSRILAAFKYLTLVARGPKPAKALSDYGLKASVVVPEPNTWREVLTTLDDYREVRKLRVAVQEYGVPNPELLQALRDRGAREVAGVPVYRWALPEDCGPLTRLVGSILNGEAAMALFTSGHQARNLFQVAEGLGQSGRLKESLSRMVLGSVGSVCSESLRSFGLEPDLEPEHPKMGFLVKEAAEKCLELCQKKAAVSVAAPSAPPAQAVPSGLSGVEIASRGTAGGPAGDTAAPADGLFLKACRREAVPRPPLWIMRQAGRYLPEYRAVRSKVPFLELCKTPELAAEVTVAAQQVLGVDAAILFADILLISEPLGFRLTFAENEGPVIHNPFRTKDDLKRLEKVDVGFDLGYVMQAVRLVRANLKPHIPLIGFAGAPFTLASYLIEGGGSKDYFHTRSVMGDIVVWDELMKRLVEATVSYLNAQVEAGAQAVQLFDSWVGILSPEEFQRLALPYLKFLILHLHRLQPDIPVVYFGTQTEPFFPWLRETGATVIGVDWRTPLDRAWQKLGDVAVQGNLDPSVLLTDPATVEEATREVLRLAGGRPGHIFNLGHGILPNTPLDNVHAMIETVKNWKP